MAKMRKDYDSGRVIQIDMGRKAIMLHLGDGHVDDGPYRIEELVFYIPDTEEERNKITADAYKPCQLVIFKAKYINESTGHQYAERIEDETFPNDVTIVPKSIKKEFVVDATDPEFMAKRAKRMKAEAKSKAKKPWTFQEVIGAVAVGCVLFYVSNYLFK